MSSVRPDIEHWWAVEAMIASYNHVYRVIYKTCYEERGAIGVSDYEGAPIASFHYEFHALSANPQAVMEGVHQYSVPEGRKHMINFFHTAPSDAEMKDYLITRLGYEFVRTGPILGFDVPLKVSTIPLNVHKARDLQHTEVANNSLTAEGERIHLQTLGDPHIHNFFVNENGQAVGWIQLVSVYPNVGYINQLYVLEDFRKRKFATTLVNAVQSEAIKLGIKKMITIPSDLAMHLFRRMGYRPLLYFSAFRPKLQGKPWVRELPTYSPSQPTARPIN